MALIKFLTDVDCSIFVDMEYVGNTSTVAMLKINLDKGSYFIQIKDGMTGPVLKEYDLNVTDESQRLERISLNEELRMDSFVSFLVDRLKNDPNLEFVEDRAAFCDNGLWGFIDNDYNVVISPQYKSVKNYDNGKSLVVKQFADGERITVINKEGSLVFGKWFTLINETENLLLLKFQNKLITINKKLWIVEKEYFDAGYETGMTKIPCFIMHGFERRYGYINQQCEEIVPFIFDLTTKSETVVLYGNECLLDENNVLKYEQIEDPYNADSRDCIIQQKEDWTNRPFSYYVGYDYPFFQHICPIKKDQKWGLCDEMGKDIVSPQYDRIIKISFCKSTYSICFQEANLCYLYVYNWFETWNDNNLKICFECDLIKPMEDIFFLSTKNISFYIFKKQGKYGVVDSEKRIIKTAEYDQIIKSANDSCILTKNGKDGVFSLKKNVLLLPFIYDKVEACAGFRVCIDNLYGLISHDLDTILKIEYDYISLISPSEESDRELLGYFFDGTFIIAKNGSSFFLLREKDNSYEFISEKLYVNGRAFWDSDHMYIFMYNDSSIDSWDIQNGFQTNVSAPMGDFLDDNLFESRSFKEICEDR